MKLSTDYSYDKNSRLITCQYAGEAAEQYAYDATGNLLYRGTGAPPPVRPAEKPRPAPAQRPAAAEKPSSKESWQCVCGRVNKGAFCPKCGAKKPDAAAAPAADTGWRCSCGRVNSGAFCPKCGSKRPS